MQDLDKFKNEMNLSGKNVYVGHRYVPKLVGEWDNSKTYESLSIVQYQGNSFTSRQNVPVGIEITNEDYWAATGNYNAQVENYRRDVVSLGTKIDNHITDNENDFNELNEASSKLNDRIDKIKILNIQDFGAKGDGVTDDTDIIQSVFDIADEGTEIISSNGDYVITKPIEINKDNINFNGLGANFLWRGTADLGIENSRNMLHGVFEFKGTISDDEYIASGVEKVDGGLLVKMETAEYFNVDEHVIFTAKNNTSSFNYNSYSPDIQITSKVLKVNTDGIVIDYISDFDFDKLNLEYIKIDKADLIKNPTIQNVNIIDETESAPEDIPGTERGSWVNGVYFDKALNPRIIGVTVKGHKGKAFKVSNSIYGYAQNIYAGSPKATGGGAGYGMQVLSTQKFTIRDFKGDKNRHLIDFTKSAHISVYSSIEHNSPYGTFDCHGFAEHDIHFTDCQGSWILGNGIVNNFPCVTENININNSIVNNLTIHGVHNLNISNSKVEKIAAAPAVNMLTLDNVELPLKFETDVFYVTGKKRGYFENNNIVLNNIKGNFESIGKNNRGIIFREFDTVNINNGNFKGGNGYISYIGLRDIDKIKVVANNFENMSVKFDGVISSIKIETNSFTNTLENETISNGSQFIDITNAITPVDWLYIFMSNNDFNSTLMSRWIRIGATINQNTMFSTADNFFSGNLYESVQSDDYIANVIFIRNVNRDFIRSTHPALLDSKILNTINNFNYGGSEVD